ncbi:MAG TPA: ROK family transcriptional regulator [Limnochordia bacterium]|nr:ROK family transcriptional regulator [Limnochordia bacterium]
MSTLRTGDRAMIRELNTSIVLDCIRRHGPIARSQIAAMTGMGRSTISGIVAFLQEKGLVEPVGSGASTGGRKPEMLAFKPDRYVALGVKLQPGGIRACLADLSGSVVASAEEAVPHRDLKRVLDALDRTYTRMTQDLDPDRLLGAGLAIPGLVDSSRGISVHPHFFEWRDAPLRQILEQRWEVPVWIDNDARVGALGEKWALAEEGATFLFVTIGIGIGAGIVLNDALMEGDLVGAGHLGHMMVEPDGSLCHCGLRGCLETVASDAALLRYFHEAAPAVREAVTVEDVFARAMAGDPAAVAAVDRVVRYLAIAIGNVIKLLGIKRVIVGGETGVVGGSLLYRRLQERVREQVFAETQGSVEVIPSRLGNDVWLVGAASLVLDAFFRPPIYADASTVLDKVVQEQ